MQETEFAWDAWVEKVLFVLADAWFRELSISLAVGSVPISTSGKKQEDCAAYSANNLGIAAEWAQARWFDPINQEKPHL